MLKVARKLADKNFLNRFDDTHTKTAIVVPSTPKTRAQIESLCEQAVKTHRPIKKTVGKKINGFYEGALTPGGTRLSLHDVFGDMAVYAEGAHVPPKLKLKTSLVKVLEKIFATQTVPEAKPAPHDAKKSMTATVTRKNLSEIKLAKKTSQEPTQAEVMVKPDSGRAAFYGSELKYRYLNKADIMKTIGELKLPPVVATEILEWLKKLTVEWCHLIDHASLGKASQVPDNLVLGTKEANTQMMVIEGLAKSYLWPNGKEKLTLKVEADLIPNTHIPKTIQYTISRSDGRTQTYLIDPLTEQAPLKQSQAYVYIVNPPS